MVLAAGRPLVEPLRDGEHSKQKRAERNPRDGSQLLGEEVDDGGGKQQQRDQSQANWDLGFADVKVARDLPLAVLRFFEAQYQHGQRLESEAPDDTEGVERCQQVHVSATRNDGKYLQ